jgi:hypothetical protein
MCDGFVARGSGDLRRFKPIGFRKTVCELRVLKPSPGARLVGGFVDASTFVATHVYRRDELPCVVKNNVGMISWRAAAEAASVRWRAIFPDVSPVPFPLLLED